MTYDNTNRWTLNEVAQKQNPKHADYKGKLNIDGKLYWLDGWITNGPNGEFISGTAKPTERQLIPQNGSMIEKPDPISTDQQPERPFGSARSRVDMDDDISF